MEMSGISFYLGMSLDVEGVGAVSLHVVFRGEGRIQDEGGLSAKY